jgi:hypothetical protein
MNEKETKSSEFEVGQTISILPHSEKCIWDEGTIVSVNGWDIKAKCNKCHKTAMPDMKFIRDSGVQALGKQTGHIREKKGQDHMLTIIQGLNGAAVFNTDYLRKKVLDLERPINMTGIYEKRVSNHRKVKKK